MNIQFFSYCILTIVMVWTTPVSAQNISKAAAEGDLARVKSQVEQDHQLVNFSDEQGRTPLHWASRGVHLDVLEYLVENGADVNAVDDDKVTPLHSLSYRGNTKAMEILMEEGANVETKDSNGLTPLIYAAYAGQEEASASLLRYGAGVGVRDDSGLTAVDTAEDQGYESLTRYLLSMGAELTPVADPELTQLTHTIQKITFCYQQCTNMLVAEGPDGVLVIDTGYRRTAEKLETAIHDISKRNKTTIVNTHQHYDHIGGNSVAGGDDVIISGETLEQMAAQGIVEKSNVALQGLSGRSHDGGYTLNFGEHSVRLLPLGGAHTDSDVIVHFQGAGIVHMGDLLISESFPSLTRGTKVVQYMAILEKVIDIFDEQTLFIGGHGRNLRKNELVEYRDMLQETINIVTSGLKSGSSTEAMQQAGVLNEYTSYNTFIPMLNMDYWIETVAKSYPNGNRQTAQWPILKGPYLGQKPPGMKPELFAPGIISTEDLYEMNSVFSPDGEEFYFGISASSKEEKTRGIYHYDLMFTKIENGVWIKPVRLPLAGKYSVADIALSPDGNRLYFCSEMPSVWDSAEGFDIWYVERIGEGWSEPINVGKKINSPYGETQPSFTADGSMYFPSRPKGPTDEGDLYYARFEDGEFSEPVRLSDNVNSIYGDGNSFVSPDESYILFARWGMPESIDGGKATYISFRNRDGSWTPAKNTKPETGIYGSLAALSPDGKYLFYSSRANIYWVDARVIDQLRPAELQ